MTGQPGQSRREEAITLLETGLALLTDITHDTSLSPSEELGLFARLNTAADKLATRLTITAADLDHRHIAETATGLNLSTWLMSKRHATRAQASKVMRTGQALAAHPQVQEAAISGAVSKDQANAITTLLDNLPTRLRDEQKARAAAFLVEKAKSNNTNQLRGLTTEALDAADPAISEADAAEREQAHLQAQRERAIRSRALRHRYEDGSLHFSGQVPTSEGAELVRLLEAQVAADRRDERDHPQAGAPSPTPEQRNADALLTILRRRNGSTKVAGDSARIVVIMHEESLAARVEQAGLLPDGTKIPAGDLRRIACDADITPIVLGTHSEVLDVGRSHRLVTDPIRLALSIRDGGCAFPGCTEPDYRCSAHHPVPWWQGGTTALNNLVLLCDLHHTTVEPPRIHPTLNGRARDGTPTRRDDNRERWEVRINTNGLPEFLPPARLDPDRRPIPAHGTLPIAS